MVEVLAMTPKDIEDGWHQASISRVVAEMIRIGATPWEVAKVYQAMTQAPAAPAPAAQPPGEH